MDDKIIIIKARVIWMEFIHKNSILLIRAIGFNKGSSSASNSQ